MTNTDTSDYVRWALHHNQDPEVIEHEFDAAIEEARDMAWGEAVERVWQAFMELDWEDPSISPKELYAVLEAVKNEDRSPLLDNLRKDAIDSD